jgi:hypothetical protein
MIINKVEGDKFLAKCARCDQWRKVEARCTRTDTYFAYWESPVSCCGLNRTAVFTVEKDEVDIH